MRNRLMLCTGLLLMMFILSSKNSLAATVNSNVSITAEGDSSVSVNSQLNTSIKSSSTSSKTTTVSKKVEVTTNGEKKTYESNTLGTTSLDIRNGSVKVKELPDEEDPSTNQKSGPTLQPTMTPPSAQAKDMSLGSMITYRIHLFLQKLFKF